MKQGELETPMHFPPLSDLVEKVGSNLVLPTLERALISHPEYQSQARAWEQSNVSVPEFLEENRGRLRNITVGASWAPEEFGLTLGLSDDEFKRREERMLSSLALLPEFGVTAVRTAIRWNNVIDKNDEINFAVYRKMFEYLLQNGLLETLNIGPIKKLRYPEDHIHEKVLPFIPGVGTIIEPHMDLAKHAFEHEERLLEFLTREYGNDWLSTLQLDNEPTTRYGPRKLLMGQKYLEETIKRGHEYFPNAKILLNSVGTPTYPRAFAQRRSGIDDNMDFAAAQKRRDGSLSFIVGIDYYHEVGDFAQLNFPHLGRPDQIFLGNILGRNVIHRLVERAEEGVFHAQATEVQIEPWGVCKDPGNSTRHAIFAATRLLDAGITDQSFWGLEYQTQKKLDGYQTQEHKGIQQLLAGMSDLSKAA